MIVATWNVNSLRARIEHVQRWLVEAQPDVLCLQETKVTDGAFPSEALSEAGYPHQAIHGQRTYNGVAILSRLPLQDPVAGWVHAESDPQARLVRATVGGVRIFCCYTPMGTAIGHEKFRYKLGWLRRLRQELEADTAPDQPVLVCGDLNVAFDDLDVWDPFEADGKVLYSEAERQALGQLTAWGLSDAYRTLHPHTSAFTWWDYRGGAFRHNKGFRIDHVLVTDPLLPRLEKIEVHKHTRGWDKPSDHAPVVVELSQ